MYYHAFLSWIPLLRFLVSSVAPPCIFHHLSCLVLTVVVKSLLLYSTCCFTPRSFMIETNESDLFTARVILTGKLFPVTGCDRKAIECDRRAPIAVTANPAILDTTFSWLSASTEHFQHERRATLLSCPPRHCRRPWPEGVRRLYHLI